MKSSRLLLTLLLLAGPACADPAADLKAAYGKFIEATSFRATMTDLKTGKAVSQIEFAAPDRYAITATGGMRQVMIGRTMYMDLGGKVMRIPLPEKADPSQYRNQRALDELSAGLSVEQRPDSNDTGEPARVYHYVSQAEGKPVATLTWVSKASGLPVQVQTDAGDKDGFRYQIRYSHFNDASIVVTAPE